MVEAAIEQHLEVYTCALRVRKTKGGLARVEEDWRGGRGWTAGLLRAHSTLPAPASLVGCPEEAAHRLGLGVHGGLRGSLSSYLWPP